MDGLRFPKPVPRERKAAWKKAPHSKSCACAKCERKRTRNGVDEGREEFARSRPCVGMALDPAHICRGDIQASHDRNKTGLARKEPSRKTVPKCAWLHEEWERHRGAFEGWDNDRRHYWMRDRVAEVNIDWDALPESQRDWWRGEAERKRRLRAEAFRSWA